MTNADIEILLRRIAELEARVLRLEERQPIMNGKRWNGEDWEPVDA